ncbi:hypothetical protein [Streptomyces sp. CAI-85]|uniref:hypothetical protein n=1 Tax=Streptomyces sp. CAI-85 TaxID=1472662 RepID=UPI0015879581|nr:hypothetical protein [Streptomyces sp. CAI-85]NUV60432.1 hypothetical protein [Streptomyces sp. CAI-85]
MELDKLRHEELQRREQRRLARENGSSAPLRGRRCSQGDGRPAEGHSAVAAEQSATEPLRLPTRVSHVLRRVLEEAGEPPDLLDRVAARAGEAPEPLRAVAADAFVLLSRLEPLPALGYLLDLASGGIPVLVEEDRSRAEAIRSGRLPAPSTQPGHVDAWQLHLEAHEAQGRATLSTESWQRLVERLPLPVVDDLIDRRSLPRGLAPHTWLAQSERVRYVTARLEPGRLSDADVAALDWRDEACRRALAEGDTVDPVDGRHDEWSLRSALLAGDVSALDEADAYADLDLPLELDDLVRSLRHVRRGGPVDGRLGRDRSLFGLLEDCVPAGRLISGSTPFHHWAGTRRLYRILDDMHWAMACEPEQVEPAVRAALQQAAALRNPEPRGAAGSADREARAVQAYLTYLHARPGDRDRLDQAVGLLEDVLKRGGKRRGGVDGPQKRRLRTLSELLQALRLKGKPHDVLNPYLALCVEHGSSEWGQGWRDLRRQVPSAQLEYINGAKDRIRRIETAERLGQTPEILYEIPVSERFLWVPDDHAELLHPGPRPLERRTHPSTVEEKSWTAAEAAREIIGRCAGRLRTDH